MARRKAAKKTGKQAARKYITRVKKLPANDLPPELIHMVFRYLEPTEAAAFRWAGRVVAEIGLQYLVPTVHLALMEESYDRLLAIAEHPMVSKYVVKLEYETEGLMSTDREQFDQMIRFSEVIPQRQDSSERPSSSASARACRAYEQQSVRNIPLLSQRHMNRAWSMYEQYHASQMKVQEADFFPEKIAKAMKQFSNLKRICTSADGARERYVAEIKGLLPTCYYSQPIPTAWEDPLNVGATSSVMLAVGSAGLHLESFCCQSVNWEIFTQNKKNFATLKKSLFRVKEMNVAFSTRLRMYDRDRTVQEFIKKGYVVDLVTSAPDLEYLELAFRPSYGGSIKPTITATIGNFFWPSLKSVCLENLSTDGHGLVDFCKRHAYTIKNFSLTNMKSYEASWDAVFHGVRRAFRLGQQLDTCKLLGQFIYRADSSILMDRNPSREGEVISAGMLISSYIRSTKVGDISLDEFLAIRMHK